MRLHVLGTAMIALVLVGATFAGIVALWTVLSAVTAALGQ